MTDTWFHATPDGGRNGPMRADDLVRLCQAGRIHTATPVWRAGMADWVPLSSVAATLGLPAMPPPIPRAPPPPLPPRRGLHWIWIVVLALAALAVPVVAILAAIAFPAYTEYRARSGIAEVAAATAPLRVALQSHQAGGKTCPLSPSNRMPGADRAALSDVEVAAARADLLAHVHVARVLTAPAIPAAPAGSERPSDGCEIMVGLQGFDLPAIDGQTLTWSLDSASGDWTCGGTLADRYLPSACRH